MKTALITSVFALCALVSSNAYSQDKKIVTTDSSADSSLCAAIAKDRPLLIQKRLREARLTKDKAKRVLRCNGLSLSEFAYKHNSSKTIAKLSLEPSLNQLAKNSL